MHHTVRLSREQFHNRVVLAGEQRFRSWPTPVYGLDSGWTGSRVAGSAEMDGAVLRSVSLSHGEPAGTGPLVDVGVTAGDPVELAQHLDRTSWPSAPPLPPVRPRPGVAGAIETTVVVDGVAVPALQWPTGVGWAAAATLPAPLSLGLALAARDVDPDGVRLVRVELEPYLAARRDHLLSGYDQA
ncbi:MAG TPA: hypothetical protein VEL73_02220 [Mycobacteriales bacterium]|nr:hypothetical protein [Mycobacteriales bacterium]